jgi:polysaccharide deacetylase 2 family uncharacterized protein YibQ
MARKKLTKLEQAYRLIPILGAVIVLLSIVIWTLVRNGDTRATEMTSSPQDFAEVVRELAAIRGVRDASIRADDPIRKIDGVFVRSWWIELGSSEKRQAFVSDLGDAAESWHGTVEYDPAARPGGESVVRVAFDSEAFDIRLGIEQPKPAATAAAEPTPIPTPAPRPTLDPSQRGRLAILLDDAGQSTELIEVASALPSEIGAAILPFLPHSSATAVQLHKTGHEVWVHLPMEPEGYPLNDPGPGAILLSMTEAEVRSALHAAVNSVPNAVGVNNHMGSRATANLKTMTWVMQELGARNLAFIDSRTTVRTVAEEAARYQGVAAGRRHVFLDNTRTESAIRKQLDEAVYLARSQGSAIAIGHFTSITVRVLERELPKLKQRGADLVPPTKLLK